MNDGVVTEKRLVIGVDIGGTIIKCGVVDPAKGKVLKEISTATPNANSHDIAKLVARQVNILSHSYPDIMDVGIGVPGSLNPERTLAKYPPNFPLWSEEPLAEYVKQALPHFDRVEMDNDANAATLAEATFGAGKKEKYFLLATLGTGVGGGIWADGAIFRGAFGGAGEFGHISIAYDGDECNCGSRGCIEAYIGRQYLIKRTVAKLTTSKTPSSLRSKLPPNLLDPKDITEAAMNGDAFAIDVLKESGNLLGVAFANVAKLLDIRTFIVTGGIAEAKELLLVSARESLIGNVFVNQKESVRIVESKLANKAGVIGAALLVR